MPRLRDLLQLVPPAHDARTATAARRAHVPSPRARRSPSPAALLGLLALGAAGAGAQERAVAATPLHLAANRFEFVAKGDTLPLARPLRVHNGGSAGFTDVRVTKVSYADPASGAAWLVSVPRQTSVAPDELATVGTLCVDPTGLPAGTYRAMAGVVSREVTQPVEFLVTLVVTDAGARAPRSAPRA